ncbi:HemK2/MTQ2 family protein methyltransferase [Streptantibioticus cattleyicolor]|uniref:Methyltransferase n=1 Tax=Streptantibioticus cattleyicolor (strain ATCC 35852 / DSM 46488 / JCM 4925 / NBRC 14057 / NRRL 8057) TaxID=1003195 RepID=F8JJ68_STREN|nr:HemK2/MTQ2 family protein methyltransferase [Streptantibioticus cattleyicolor]AEW98829.1 methyltransferase [Streptantibioticus cattleyicolor NRRL 8057 = DSM 46488]CCB72123.1 putative methyltransferase [Streptantibioticus cattleyicolor NRRL 8057 = DSM 46488]
MLLRLPGVYPPQRDTWLLVRALRAAAPPPGARVLDVCSGTGALALAAAAAGAGPVTAVDVSRRAVWAARANAALRGRRVRVLRGDLLTPVGGELFDVIVANPPYVAAGAPFPARGAARGWDAGADGRAVLDRICRRAPALLAPDGTLLLVHSALSGTGRTLAMLRCRGLKAAVVDRATVPFGPVMRSRAPWLRERGLIDAGTRTEELVVIRADRPARR